MKQKYFDRVRWVELVMASLSAALVALQLDLSAGGKLGTRSVLGAVVAGLSVGLAYFRDPKEPGGAVAGSLPEGVDATGPGDDVEPDVLKEVVAGVLAPSLGPSAGHVAGNVVNEARRVLRRGVRW